MTRAPAEIDVDVLTPAASAEWDGFVGSQPDATFFHLSGWHTVIAEGLGQRPHFLIARRRGQVQGILPLAQVKSRLFGNNLVSTPGCVEGGILAADPAVREALKHHACALANKLGVDALEMRHVGAEEPDWPTKTLYVRFRKTITDDDDANMKAIPRKQRAMVRKGIKVGLRSELTGDIDRFYAVYAESVRNLGTPVFPKQLFKVLTRVFGPDCELAMVRHNGADIAGVMSFYFRDQVLPYYGGSRPVARSVYGNDFMYWDLMCRAARRGVRVFDYGRSKRNTGSFSFKKNWGFEPEPLHYQYYLVRSKDVPEVNPNNPKYRYLIEVWKRLPLPLANAMGPMLARHLA